MRPKRPAGPTTANSGPILAQRAPGTRWSTAATLAAGCLAMTVAACSNDTGYVEIRTYPASSSALPPLYVDWVKVEPRKGTAVLRQPVGTTQLQTDAGGEMIVLCDVVVKKNRVTTVTVSLVDRLPRCQCRADMTVEQRDGRVCIG